MSLSNQYARWSGDELRRAERIADQFLSNHNQEIYQSFNAQLLATAELLQRLRADGASLEERLDCFARIAEISGVMQSDAYALFELASEPGVARLLASAL